MAKRYPLSRASKAYEEICKLEPMFTTKAFQDGPLNLNDSLLAAFSAQCLKDTFVLTGETDRRRAIAELNMLTAQDGSHVTPDDLVWVSRWHGCRQVYRIDDAVAAELPATELDDEIPCGVFTRLPYPIIYVEHRFKTPLLTGETVDVAGFISYTITWNDGKTRLGIVMIRPNGGRLFTSIPCDETVTVKSLVESCAAVVDENGDPLPSEKLPYGSVTGYDDAAGAMAAIVSSLLYIISAEDDVETVYAPPTSTRSSKPGRRTNPETVTMVGAKMGRALDAARRVSSPTPATPTGRTVSPHIRAAHWQHFWTGKRRGREDDRFGDELIVRWVPPVSVNEGMGDVTETVHI